MGDATLFALACQATATLVRLDERLRAAPSSIAAGFLARAFVHEAAASSRLDGALVAVDDLLLLDRESLDRPADPELGRAKGHLEMLRSAARRHPNQLFTPRRLIAVASLRLTRAADRPAAAMPDWLRERSAEPDEIRRSLERALAPEAVTGWNRQPALVAAADLLARWHAGSAAATLIGGGAGRILAASWPRRAGLTAPLLLLPSIGFLGYAASYRPEGRAGATPRWTRAFLEAAQRAAEWGLRRLAALETAAERLRARCQGERRTSRLPALADLLIASPALFPRRAAAELAISPVAARGMLEELRRQSVAREITGRSSFRLYDIV
jgi:hypothetical protein